MKIAELPTVAREALGIWSALRTIGYPADDIYMGLKRVANVAEPGLHVVVELRVGPFRWNGIAGLWPDDYPPFEETYKQMFEAMQASTNEERKRAYEATGLGSTPGAEARLATSLALSVPPPKGSRG